MKTFKVPYLFRKLLPLGKAHISGLIRYELCGPLPVPPALCLLPLLVNIVILVLIIVVPNNMNIEGQNIC